MAFKWEREKVATNTKIIIANTPHSPSGCLGRSACLFIRLLCGCPISECYSQTFWFFSLNFCVHMNCSNLSHPFESVSTMKNEINVHKCSVFIEQIPLVQVLSPFLSFLLYIMQFSFSLAEILLIPVKISPADDKKLFLRRKKRTQTYFLYRSMLMSAFRQHFVA